MHRHSHARATLHVAIARTASCVAGVAAAQAVCLEDHSVLFLVLARTGGALTIPIVLA